ncbi:hypothetical protein [Brucella haematophila]|uniref:hypothetical protein n=1 Tax=Brucella haematophila TaxID=419474 RepID=UPI001AEE1F24|nr:hypothetical protein [Brucella haematophila]
MTDLSKLTPQALKAAMTDGTQSWGQHGNSETQTRYMEPRKSRRKCHCGCKGRETHIGMCNGVGLASGCEWSMSIWVKGGHGALIQYEKRRAALREKGGE